MSLDSVILAASIGFNKEVSDAEQFPCVYGQVCK